MTEKEFQKAVKKHLIRFENDKVKDITVRYNQFHHKPVFEICVETSNYREICFDIDKMDSFMNVINYDKKPDNADVFWYLWHALDKYVRIIIYDTPEDEMHQLSDAHEIVGFMNIVHDDSYLLF